MESSIKEKIGNSHQLVHHVLTGILIKDALQNPRIPITWTIFNDLPAEDDIKTFTYGVNSLVSEEEEKQ